MLERKMTEAADSSKMLIPIYQIIRIISKETLWRPCLGSGSKSQASQCGEPDWSHARPCEICDEWSGERLSPKTSVFLPKYHSTSAPNSYFIHLRPILH